VRRPYVFIYKDEKDRVERNLINLATATVDCLEDGSALGKIPNSFTIVTDVRAYLIGCQTEREFNDWLYAINPLLAGQIR
jgi:kinesin family protein 1